MRILFVKLTSMGDLIHALPALSDAKKAIPDISFDWVIDKNFAEIAEWHPAVRKIIPTSHREWRKNIWQSLNNGEIKSFFSSMREEKYDFIIDGQSSAKSAFAAFLGRGTRHGLDKHSARESIAAHTYHYHYSIDKNIHAIKRLRLLLSQALVYRYQEAELDYGIADHAFAPLSFALPKNYLVFIHNASWQSKLWPETYWRELTKLAALDGFHVLLPSGNEAEKKRAERIAKGLDNATALPRYSLSEYAQILKGAAGAICSDTGLGHLCAALNIPSLTLYGSTDPLLAGTTGLRQAHYLSPFSCTLCFKRECHYDKKNHAEAICLAAMTPEMVWKRFTITLGNP